MLKIKKKIYIRGDADSGDKIIKHLEKLGGKNSNTLFGIDPDALYYIGAFDNICHINNNDVQMVWLLTQLYSEIYINEI